MKNGKEKIKTKSNKKTAKMHNKIATTQISSNGKYKNNLKQTTKTYKELQTLTKMKMKIEMIESNSSNLNENTAGVVALLCWSVCVCVCESTHVCMEARPRLQMGRVSLALSTDRRLLESLSTIQSLRLQFSADTPSRFLRRWHEPTTRDSRNSTCSETLTHTHTERESQTHINS